MRSQLGASEIMVMGMKKADIEALLKEKEWINLYLGEYYSDDPEAKDKQQKVITNADNILVMFGIDEWREHLIEVKNEDYRSLSIPEDKASSFGKYLLESGYWDLPIEDEEYGWANVNVLLEASGVQLEFQARGDFWTDATYTQRRESLV